VYLSIVHQLQIAKNGRKTFRCTKIPLKRTKIIPIDAEEEAQNIFRRTIRVCWFYRNPNIQADSSFTADGKMTLKN
jgi:hypothetical protein